MSPPTLHVGPPQKLSAASAAIEAWTMAHGRTLGGVSCEIYGDPGEEAEAFDVRVNYPLGWSGGPELGPSAHRIRSRPSRMRSSP